MEVSVELVKKLREQTKVGILDCKQALVESGGDLEKAVTILREKGIAQAAAKAGREAAEGSIFSYIHPGGKIGVLLELNCETDFVARTPEFQTLGKDLCLQVAATNPLYLSEKDVPSEEIEKEKEIYRKQVAGSGKPEKILEKIVAGKLEKYFDEVCLLRQGFVKDPKIPVEQLIKETIAKVGENIKVGRFVCFRIGKE